MSIVVVKPMKKRRNTFKDFRDYQAIQQGIFIALLSRHISIEIKKPLKRTIVTKQVINLGSLLIGEERLDIAKFIESRCDEIRHIDFSYQLSTKAINQRCAKNRLIELHHLLLDLLREYGYFFVSTTWVGKDHSRPIELVHSIYYQDKLIMNQKSIKEKGDSINNYICSRIEKEEGFVIEKGNFEMNCILTTL